MIAQALTEYERLLCDGCGHPLYETLADERTAEYHYDAPPPSQCLACAESARRMKLYEGQEIPGFKFTVVKKPGNVLA